MKYSSIIRQCCGTFLILSITGCSWFANEAKPTSKENGTVSVGGSSVDSDILQQDTIMKAMPSGGKFEDPKHGEEQWFAVGSVAGKEGTPANGVAQAHFFADGSFVMEMQLNIYTANEGRFYQAWLTKDGAEWEPAGTLRSHFGDARHQLKFETQKDLRGLSKVMITMEADDGDPKPGLVVAEGELKERKR